MNITQAVESGGSAYSSLGFKLFKAANGESSTGSGGWTNSGIYLHAPEHGRNIWVGMKINLFHQVDRELRGESVGSIFPIVAPRAATLKSAGEWNTFVIRMVGEKVTVELNGKTVVNNVTMENLWEPGKPIYSTGAIELQNHGNTLYFRNIYIREL